MACSLVGKKIGQDDIPGLIRWLNGLEESLRLPDILWESNPHVQEGKSYQAVTIASRHGTVSRLGPLAPCFQYVLQSCHGCCGIRKCHGSSQN